ncbi:preprotein translocase subunit SecG [Candidatus Parcubacteria bacterium]|nr:preprotein translocase subunit SecG [Candidatus Parcubacteria bacterium]
MVTILPIIQIILSVILVAGILLQSSAAGLGGALGGGSDNVDAGYHTRRGSEKTLFNGTVVVAILFVIVSIISFIIG